MMIIKSRTNRALKQEKDQQSDIDTDTLDRLPELTSPTTRSDAPLLPSGTL